MTEQRGDYRDSEVTGAAGVSYACHLVDRQGMIFRVQAIRDRGIDAEIEIKEPQDGRIIKAQIKTGPSYFTKLGDGLVHGKPATLERWRTLGVPVIVVVCDYENYECLWEVVSDETARKTPKGWAITVPRTQRLSEAKDRLREIAAKSDSFLSLNYVKMIADRYMYADSWDSNLRYDVATGTVQDFCLSGRADGPPSEMWKKVSVEFAALGGKRERDTFMIGYPSFDLAKDDDVSIVLVADRRKEISYPAAAVNYTKMNERCIFLNRVWGDLYPLPAWVQGGKLLLSCVVILLLISIHHEIIVVSVFFAIFVALHCYARWRYPQPSFRDAKHNIESLIAKLQQNESLSSGK